MSEGTEIQVASKSAIVPLPQQEPDDIVVVANTSEEMEAAQLSLIGWVTKRIALCEAEAAEAAANVELAKKRKWKVSPFQKISKEADSKVVYYKKMRRALELGYTIMPDLPGILMCVRTSQTSPRRNEVKVSWGERNLPDAETSCAPEGEGAYVAPQIKFTRWDTKIKRPGTEIVDTTNYARAHSFDFEVDFPVKLVKPQILEQTDKAMLLKIFDEIVVVVPEGSSQNKRQVLRSTRPDPIVLGRIVRNEGSKRISCAFLITWWLDTRSL